MSAPKRAGRPRRPLPEPAHVLTERVRRLIDDVHHGKVRDSSRLTGVPYPTLNDLYIGRSVNPNLATLDALCAPYGISPAWLLSEAEPVETPQREIVVYVPPHAGADVKRRSLREVRIPMSALPMYELFTMLLARLEEMDASANRPVVGEATGDALRFRLSTFLFQPLLSAERAGEKDVFTGSAAHTAADARDSERWRRTLVSLGEMWKAVLPGTLSDSCSVEAPRGG